MRMTECMQFLYNPRYQWFGYEFKTCLILVKMFVNEYNYINWFRKSGGMKVKMLQEKFCRFPRMLMRMEVS